MTKESSGMPPFRPGLLWTEEQVLEAAKAHVEEEFKRLNAFADSIGAPDDLPSRWLHVALHLGRLHVPSLQVSKRRGAPRIWTDFDLGMLAVEVDRLVATGKTVSQSTAEMAKRAPWKGFVGQKERTQYVGNDPGEALRRQYVNANKSKWTRPGARRFQKCAGARRGGGMVGHVCSDGW